MAGPSSTSVAAIVPAKQESETVGQVVRCARDSSLVDEVIVVVPPSDDDTPKAAQAAGARVVPTDVDGKGEAMLAGVRATDAPVILFLDADLIGLRAQHVDALVRPVLDGRYGMACGLFDRGPLLNRLFLHVLPILTGERALRRELFEGLTANDIAGYKAEGAINALAAQRNVPILAFVCEGMWHRTKEEKFGNPMVGFLRKVAMLLTAVWSSVRMWGLGRRLREGARRR